MTLWCAEDAAQATGGRATGDWCASGVSIDTRTLQPGDLFVALSAARDGHEFVQQALAKGAAAALVSHLPDDVAADAPLLIVDDVQAGLEALGRAGRARSAARVVAVTGSVGKTSTKEMLRDVLGRQGRAHAAEASYNNHWGVPLTLARMPRDTEFAVIEIGMNHPGEIAPLARMARPHVALITTVAAAHLEAFENVDGIAREKASIFEGLEPGGVAVINADVDTAPILRAAAEQAAERVISFGTSRSAHHRLLNVELHDRSTVARARAWRTPLIYKVGVPGRHFALNALAVLAVVQVLGCDRAVAIADLAEWAPPMGRGTREELVLDLAGDGMSIDLIDDAFNANPSSMAAALEVLAASLPRDGVGRVSRGRRIAILGDMLELGAGEITLHSGLADLPFVARLDEIHCVGPRMRALWEALPDARRGRWAETAEQLAPKAHRLIDAGDVVLVKGSKGSKVSLVVDALRRAGRLTGKGSA
ncbi:UDP-N-acetylmuramoyl-tripeptide--D-alanyl-D-alanine ligase [uncultured Roseovarius sp.]|uniref:UDP-N-acetylmuramoyl-tripeptide--D-alanyl-D- alanine ligase n=1 Tax=uncultured Roseovarius sp. TaxID=293344 RepID=UPI0026131EAA|nr:UDP-N-acetylmuramoyl-tripeptide--D-alanyl-D-alanine ligase [uncultured Roseovarius sp.]